MSREKDLAKNTVILSLGKFLPKLVSVVTLPIVTGQLTKTEYGTYDLISTLIMLVMPIVTLQIQSAAFRFLVECRGDEERTKQIISNIFIFTVPISLIVALIIPFFISDISAGIGTMIGFYFVLDILMITVSQVARGLSYNKNYSISSIILSCVNGLGIVITISQLHTGVWGVYCSLVGANLVGFLYLFFSCKIWKYITIGAFSPSLLKELLAYSWPMIPNNLSNWVLKVSDRFVIKYFLGTEANAIYAVANKIPNLLSIAQSVLIMAWHENASIAVKDEDSDLYYSSMFDRIFSLVCGFTALLIAFTPLMFAILIKGDYDEAYLEMPILILAMLFCCMCSFQGGIYIAHMKTKSVGLTTILAAGVNFVVDIALVNFLGITAGSISTLVSYFVLFVYRMFDVKKFQKINYNYPKMILQIVLIIAILYLCSLQLLWANIVNGILGCLYSIYYNHEYVGMLLTKLKKKRGV